MKNKIAIATAFFAASCLPFAEIVLTDSLSIEGFADMSYSRTEDDKVVANQTENSHNLDQVEITFLLDFDVLTAQLDLQWEDGTGYSVDQAFTSYSPSNGIVITVGSYDSMLGFEASEPTGLFQYSGAYSSDTETFIDDDVTYSDIITGSEDVVSSFVQRKKDVNLNIDFSEFSNHVFFGSAKSKLENFKT